MALASRIDFARLRADTPGCAHVLHLNAAGSALPSQRTLDATLDHLRLEAEIGGYEAAAQANDQLEGFYPAVARLIGADSDEIAFVERLDDDLLQPILGRNHDFILVASRRLDDAAEHFACAAEHFACDQMLLQAHRD